jgi:excisionase family DNA binding protein
MASQSTALSGWEKGPRVLAAKWDGRSAFTVEEAGEILGISRWSAYEAAKKKELPVVAIGRRLIVPRHALEKLLLGALDGEKSADA